MLAELLDQPEDFSDHIHRYTDSLTTQMAFGFRIISKDEEYIKELFQHVRIVSELASTTTAALFDGFPIIRHLPDLIVPVKKRALQTHSTDKAFHLKGWMEVKKRIRDGTAKVRNLPSTEPLDRIQHMPRGDNSSLTPEP